MRFGGNNSSGTQFNNPLEKTMRARSASEKFSSRTVVTTRHGILSTLGGFNFVYLLMIIESCERELKCVHQVI